MNYDNIKIKKKRGLILSLSLKHTFLEKPEGECQTDRPLPPAQPFKD